jgi:NAD+ kinase
VEQFKRVGVLAHPLRPPTFPVAGGIADRLRACGLEAEVYTEWTDEQVAPVMQSFDVVVAIGGDGAMLRAARACAPYNVPVLGINMGQLGFLTEVRDPGQWHEYETRLLAHDFWVEQRMMLSVAVVRGGRTIAHSEALNDVVVSGEVVGRIVQLETYIDGHWTTTYNADALVISSATGSTAYALACGGPILPPELKNILVVPAAAHLSMDRPMVLSEGATVEVRPSSDNRTAMQVTADGGGVSNLMDGDRVIVQASQHVSQFVRMRAKNYFFRSLLDRFEPRVRRGVARIEDSQDE